MKTLAVVWHSDAFESPGVIPERYFKELWERRRKDGFLRPKKLGTWELPMWTALLNGSMPVHACIAARNPTEVVETVSKGHYTHVALSVMDCNKPLARKVIEKLADTGVVVFGGGYTDLSDLETEFSNFLAFKSIEEAVQALGGTYTGKYDYEVFKGMETIPRLRMSTGCYGRCKFCSVPNEVVPEPWSSVVQQAQSFEPLKFELVYLDDKTFGQAPGWEKLPGVKSIIRGYNSRFKGFIIQTTATQLLRFGLPDWHVLRKAGVQFVEVGLEIADNKVLRNMRKPHTVEQVSRAVQVVSRELGTGRVVPNIMVGLPGCGKAQYGTTLGWLDDHMEHLAHVNCYWLSLYDGTALAAEIPGQGLADRYDNSVRKSWLRGSVHAWFYDAVLGRGREALDNRPERRKGEAP